MSLIILWPKIDYEAGERQFLTCSRPKNRLCSLIDRHSLSMTG